MPPGSMTDTAATALAREKFNSSNTNTFGPTTFGVSTASDQGNNDSFAAGDGAGSTNPGTYYPLAGSVGTTSYTSNSMSGGPPFTSIPSFNGWEVSVENA